MRYFSDFQIFEVVEAWRSVKARSWCLRWYPGCWSAVIARHVGISLVVLYHNIKLQFLCFLSSEMYVQSYVSWIFWRSPQVHGLLAFLWLTRWIVYRPTHFVRWRRYRCQNGRLKRGWWSNACWLVDYIWSSNLCDKFPRLRCKPLIWGKNVL